MRRDDNQSLHFLLSGGRLSGAERDLVLERVLAQTGGTRRGWPWRWGKLTIGAAAMVPVAAALVLVTGLGSRRAHVGESETGAGTGTFRAKGAATAGPVLQAYCPARPAGRCRSGDKLIFEVDGAGSGGLLAAYADRPGGDRIWYFPTASGHLATVPAGEEHAVIGEAARLGDEHGVGRYAVHLFVLDQPADRAALLDGRARARAASVVPLEVVP